MNNVWILAKANENETSLGGVESSEYTGEGEAMSKTPADPNAPAARRESQGLFGSPLIFLGLMFVLMYFILFRGPRKKQQQHKQMVQSLRKNDRVRTIGGILGTVVDIKGDEITLKVDESTNTKIKVASSAIGKNLLQDKS